MRLNRIVPAAMIAASFLIAGGATASANAEWCVDDPPIQVITPGGANLIVNNTIYLPPYDVHLASQFTASATVVPDGHGGTLITVHVHIPSAASFAHVVSLENRFQVSSPGNGTGGTLVTNYLDVPAA